MNCNWSVKYLYIIFVNIRMKMKKQLKQPVSLSPVIRWQGWKICFLLKNSIHQQYSYSSQHNRKFKLWSEAVRQMSLTSCLAAAQPKEVGEISLPNSGLMVQVWYLKRQPELVVAAVIRMCISPIVKLLPYYARYML